MSLSSEEKIIFLENFYKDLQTWFSIEHVGWRKQDLRKSLNERASMAHEIICEADCLKLISAVPPPAVGGAILQNKDPFNMLFEDYYGRSFVPEISDMAQMAIGVIRSGRLEEVKEAKKMRETIETKEVVSEELAAPEKVTLIWLYHHVPVKFWLIAGGLLFTAFGLGIEASTWEFVRDIFSLDSAE